MKLDPVTVLDTAFELAARIGEVMHSALDEQGLTPVRAGVLMALHEHGRPMVQRELSQALRCTPRHVTALVDVLESQGWVSRAPHPSDRRATLVALTERGVEATGWMAERRRESARALLGGMSAADLDGFVTVAQHLLRHIGSDRALDDRTP
jgi:DNA-binding MarR family transcriptional regulator